MRCVMLDRVLLITVTYTTASLTCARRMWLDYLCTESLCVTLQAIALRQYRCVADFGSVLLCCD